MPARFLPSPSRSADEMNMRTQWFCSCGGTNSVGEIFTPIPACCGAIRQNILIALTGSTTNNFDDVPRTEKIMRYPGKQPKRQWNREDAAGRYDPAGR